MSLIKRFFPALLPALLAVLAAVPAPRAEISEDFGLSPLWDWKTIETERFRVTFPVELEPAARRAAGYLEEAHAILAPWLKWEPRQKTQVILSDSSDSANGATAASLRLGLILYVTPPESWSAIYAHDDWLRLLVIHEYAHFLNLDPTTGVAEVLRVLFGDAIRPNHLWYGWMAEGLAVYAETRWTRAGRGRSAYFDMIVRQAVAEGVLDKPEFITYDRIHGPNPWFPRGATAYVFGYYLINQVAKDPSLRSRFGTADGLDVMKDGEDALGLVSIRSAGRVPYFQEWNLENVAGRDFASYWDEWVLEARARADAQLKAIRAAPVTKVETVTAGGTGALGNAASPDGRWLAYNMLESSDRRTGLYLVDRKSGESTRIADKLEGVGLAFTPDSRFLVYSSLERDGDYYLHSDLFSYDVESKSARRLTRGRRAKDPDVSPDGTRVAYAFGEAGRAGIAVAPLTLVDGELEVGDERRIHVPSDYGRDANPRFSPDGGRIAFSSHENGPSERILEADVRTGAARPLTDGSAYDRFPAYDARGALHFVSDRTGVDNLYRLDPAGPVRVTNVEGGLWLPSFGRGDGALHASVFSSRGWDLARIEAGAGTPGREAVKAPGRLVPSPERLMRAEGPPAGGAPAIQAPAEDYSVIPSIWPRAWYPRLFLASDELYVAGTVLGFDATDRHRYRVGAGFDTLSATADVYGTYTNRVLGPDLSVTGFEYTSSLSTDGLGGVFYTRKRGAGFMISHPFQGTWSTFTPALSVEAERLELIDRASPDAPIDRTGWVPLWTAQASYSDAEGPALAISPERGRRIDFGVRLYDDRDFAERTVKGLYAHTEYVPIAGHTVLAASLSASWSSRLASYRDALVNVQGRQFRVVNALGADSLDSLFLRGYPGRLFLSRAVVIGGGDLRFPISRIFRGVGSWPFFFRNLSGFAFGEAAYFPVSGTSLPAAGGGLRLSTLLPVPLQVPVTLSLEYHKGVNAERGGRSEVIFQLLI